jgi:hypothetical protein
MLLRKKIIIASLSFFIIGLGFITAHKTGEEFKLVEDIALDGLFGEDDSEIPDFDIDQLRSFEDTFEQEEIPLSEKIKMCMLVIQLKTRSYHNEFLEHLSQHGNEYLIGSACIATMLISALLKSYINNQTHVS